VTTPEDAPAPPPVRVREARAPVHGLVHHLVFWNDDEGGDAAAAADPDPRAPPRDDRRAGATIVLCHGFLDFAWSFRMTAEALARRGHRVAAFDWRGHGETDWIAPGAYYHFADYVRDLAALLPALRRKGERRVHLVGHSMGGTATSLFAAAQGEDTLASLTLVEGLGPPPHPPEDAPGRFDRFLRATAKVLAGGRRHPTPVADLDDAVRRMRVRNPGLPPGELGRFLAGKATRRDPAGGPGWTWRFDPLHRTPNPNPIPVPAYLGCLETLAAGDLPLLLVEGEHGLRWPDHGERLARLGDRAARKTLPGVGHMAHWEAPEALADLIDQHVRRADLA